MAVPSNWNDALKNCKAADAAWDASKKLSDQAKVNHAAQLKLLEAQQKKLAVGLGYDASSASHSPKRAAYEKATKDDQLCKTLTTQLEALEAQIPPNLTLKKKLGEEIGKYAKLLAGPDLKGTDGKGKGIPDDIKKAHKAGTEFVAAIKKKHGI